LAYLRLSLDSSPRCHGPSALAHAQGAGVPNTKELGLGQGCAQVMLGRTFGHAGIKLPSPGHGQAARNQLGAGAAPSADTASKSAGRKGPRPAAARTRKVLGLWPGSKQGVQGQRRRRWNQRRRKGTMGMRRAEAGSALGQRDHGGILGPGPIHRACAWPNSRAKTKPGPRHGGGGQGNGLEFSRIA
jgi:hypothetical protein